MQSGLELLLARDVLQKQRTDFIATKTDSVSKHFSVLDLSSSLFNYVEKNVTSYFVPLYSSLKNLVKGQFVQDGSVEASNLLAPICVLQATSTVVYVLSHLGPGGLMFSLYSLFSPIVALGLITHVLEKNYRIVHTDLPVTSVEVKPDAINDLIINPIRALSRRVKSMFTSNQEVYQLIVKNAYHSFSNLPAEEITAMTPRIFLHIVGRSEDDGQVIDRFFRHANDRRYTPTNQVEVLYVLSKKTMYPFAKDLVNAASSYIEFAATNHVTPDEAVLVLKNAGDCIEGRVGPWDVVLKGKQFLAELI